MGRSRRADPDYVTDADRGSSAATTTKQAVVMGRGQHLERVAIRDGARDLDRTVESMPGLNRQQRDRERAMPRDLAGDISHPRMERTLPTADQVRRPLSSRQRKARSVTKRAAQERWTQTQYAETSRLVGKPQHWQEVNDALSNHAGDAQNLDETQLLEVQRVDRTIQTYERANDRGHVIYSNVEMPTMINRSNLAGFLRNSFKAGDVVCFDRFTAGAHTLHEVEPGPESSLRTAAFEIQTRRGLYLGRSDSIDDTAHLLPRGLRLRVKGTHQATYERPDGSIGIRQVIQLIDAGDE